MIFSFLFSTVAGRLVTAAIGAGCLGLLYAALVVLPERKYQTKIKKDGVTYSQCIRQAKNYAEMRLCESSL